MSGQACGLAQYELFFLGGQLRRHGFVVEQRRDKVCVGGERRPAPGAFGMLLVASEEWLRFPLPDRRT
ncbi:MAG TPA: hypothetical protein VLH10_03460, partial [Yinghuangia sp.]|nr:hypothetical protein [Yinghuangia sp.]